MSTSFNILHVRDVLGRKFWSVPEQHGPDGWRMTCKVARGSIIISCAPHGDVEYVHASIAWAHRMPSYEELCALHQAVFDDGYAYQVFVPSTYHVNIHENCLHLWGRLDGKPCLPEFSEGYGTI